MYDTKLFRHYYIFLIRASKLLLELVVQVCV